MNTTASPVTEYYQTYLGTTSQTLFSMSHPGIGVPTFMFSQFYQDLWDVTNGQWTCANSTNGGYCTAAQDCSTYFGASAAYPLTDYNFKIGLTGD